MQLKLFVSLMRPLTVSAMSLLLITSHISASGLEYVAKESSDTGYMYATEYMFRKGAVAGSNEPQITVSFLEYNKKMKSFVTIVNYKDMLGLGLPVSGKTDSFISCEDEQISLKYCTEDARGMFLANPLYKWTYPRYNDSKEFTTNSSEDDNATAYDISWKVSATGQYIVLVHAVNNSVSSAPAFTATFMQPYGLLPAQDYPKWPFYGTLSYVYLVVLGVWGYRSFKWRQDLLPVQNYLFCLNVVLLLEVFCQFEYYWGWNSNGSGSSMLYLCVLFLSALRNAASTFMLLVVALGYGVLKPSLGKTMRKCILLAAAHLTFGLVYAYGTMIPPDKLSSFLLFLIVLPISTVMTIFYYWTMHAFTQTIMLLQLRRQHVKLKMYRNLWRLLVFSFVMLLVYCIVFFVYSSKWSDVDFRLSHWQTRWFITDGYLNILYLLVFLGVMYMWRPTRLNQRYGLEQLPDDNDFENDSNNFESLESSSNIELNFRDTGNVPSPSNFKYTNSSPSSTSLFSHASLQPTDEKSQEARKHVPRTSNPFSDRENEDDILKWAEDNFGSKSPK